jgi:hypothetical protein
VKDIILCVVGLMVVLVLAASVYQSQRRFHKPLLTTPYQAVTLLNGSVVYGRLDHLGTDHPVLRDAVTINRTTDGATGVQSYEAVRLKDGEQGSDHLIFPVSALVMVAPVQPESPFGRLIVEALRR